MVEFPYSAVVVLSRLRPVGNPGQDLLLFVDVHSGVIFILFLSLVKNPAPSRFRK